MPDALVVTATGPASYFPAQVAKTQFDPVVTDLERAGIPRRDASPFTSTFGDRSA